MIKRNPEVATQPLFFGKIEDVAYEKVLCIIYPNFSLYEITALTSTLVLSFGVTIDYVASDHSMVVSEDGLPCQPTKTLDQIRIEEYSCVILPGMVNIGPALQNEKLISFLRALGEQDILIAAISSAPLLLAKAGLLNDTKFTGGIWQNFFDYFEFLPRENFQPKVVVQDKQIITAIGFAHQEFARKVILSLGLAENTDNYFKERNDYSEEDLIFTLSDQEFDQVKRSIENSL
ncbi:DJ-1/PfpI family protein [Streptococcus sp. 2A/TPW/M5]